MPKPSRKRILRIPFRLFDSDKKDSQQCGSVSLENKGTNGSKPIISSFGNLNRPKESMLPLKLLDSNSARIRIVGEVPPKSTIDVFSRKSPLKSQNVIANKLPAGDASFLSKKISGSHMDTKALTQKMDIAPRFLSILMGKGKLIRHKVISQLVRRKVGEDTEDIKHLSYAERLQLFQALMKKPLPFLDIHVRFGVSKQTMKGFIKKGLLKEMWGPKEIGVRFKLTNKGKMYLKELENAAKYEPGAKDRAFIRLKSKSSL